MKKVFVIVVVLATAAILFLLLLFGLPALPFPIRPILSQGGDVLWRLRR
jgi:hypothetical protein